MSVESFVGIARAYDGAETRSCITFPETIQRERVLLGTTLPASLGFFPAAAACELVGIWWVREPGGAAYHVVHSDTNEESGVGIGRVSEAVARTSDGGIAVRGASERWNVRIDPEGSAYLGEAALRPLIEVDG